MRKLKIATAKLTAAALHAKEYPPRKGGISNEENATKQYWSVKLKELRQKLGFTQKEFAERYCLELRAVKNWEQGERLPDRSSQTLLAMIDEDPETSARLISSARHREKELA